jgi:hypothetical protein
MVSVLFAAHRQRHASFTGTLNFGDTAPGLRKKIRPALLVPSGLLVLMVLTNDLHQFVFGFPAGLPQFEPYLYRPGFFLIAAWVAFLALGGLINLYRWAGSRKNGRYIVLLSGLIGMIILYNALYVAGVPAIRQAQMGAVFIVFILLLWELTLRGGLVPYNRYYRLLFEFGRLPLYLARRSGDICRHSVGAKPLPESVIAGVLTGQRLFYPADGPDGSLGADYEAAQIQGGFVVWQNDLQDMRRLYGNLQTIRQSLLSQTALLEKQVEHEQASQALSARRRLLEQLDGLIRPRLDEIVRLANRLSLSLPEAKLKELLCEIIDAIGYCKRIGLLYLSAAPDGSRPVRLLTLLLKETCSDCSTDGTQIALYGEPTGTVGLQQAILCLDFSCNLFVALHDCQSGSLFVHAGGADQKLKLGFLCDFSPEFLGAAETFAENKRSVLAAGGFSLDILRRPLPASGSEKGGGKRWLSSSG